MSTSNRNHGVRVALVTETADDADDLRMTLEADGISVIAHVSGDDASFSSLKLKPDVIVLRRNGGITARGRLIRRLRGESGSHVVVISPESRGHEIRAAMEAGASGFLFDCELRTALVPTIQAALADLVSVPRQERKQILRPTLSAREKQILGLVVMGYMNCEIADTLFLAESTVKSHLSSAFAKLGVRSRNEAVDLILDGEDGLGRGILAITADVKDRPAPAVA